MSNVVAYTLARIGLFGAAFGLVWLLGARWLVWDELTILWTVLVALILSAMASFWLLSGLRARLAEDVRARSRRVAERFEESRRAEDD